MKTTLSLLLVLAGSGLAQPRWVQMQSVPALPSGRAVDDGGWLEPARRTGGLEVYAVKGNRTTDFYTYSLAGDSWLERAAVPLGTENKPPDEGCRGVFDGGRYVYTSKGNNSFGFHRYDVTANAWEVLPDIPAGPDSSRARGGTDLVFANRSGTDNVYLLKGQSGEFYRFDVVAQAWSALPHAPAGTQTLWPYGSWLSYNGSNRIFAHKAGANECWAFDVAGDSWLAAARTGMPLVGRSGQPVASGDGGCAEVYSGSIYALKGNNSPELWQYFIAGDSWRQLEDVPVGVGGGGALALGDSGPGGSQYFYALAGSNNSQFWRYRAGGVPGVVENGLARLGRIAVTPSPLKDGRGMLSYSFSGSGPARLSICDAAGRRRWYHRLTLPDQGQVPLSLPGLQPGTYFLMLETRTFSGCQRVVVAR